MFRASAQIRHNVGRVMKTGTCRPLPNINDQGRLGLLSFAATSHLTDFLQFSECPLPSSANLTSQLLKTTILPSPHPYLKRKVKSTGGPRAQQSKNGTSKNTHALTHTPLLPEVLTATSRFHHYNLSSAAQSYNNFSESLEGLRNRTFRRLLPDGSTL